jgi:hypothetical protein
LTLSPEKKKRPERARQALSDHPVAFPRERDPDEGAVAVDFFDLRAARFDFVEKIPGRFGQIKDIGIALDRAAFSRERTIAPTDVVSAFFILYKFNLLR